MAFDFVSYIAQQIEQDYSNFFVNHTKQKKQELSIHLIALQLLQLSDLSEQSPKQAYDIITGKNSSWLSNQTHRAILQDPIAKQYFSITDNGFESLNSKVADILINELYQLNENAHLGTFGIQELLIGQYPWMQNQVDAWFWDAVGKPEYKVETPQKDEKAEFNQVMKEFSQMIHEQSLNQQQLTLDKIEQIQIHKIYHILNPLLAAIIIYTLFFKII